MSVCVCVCVCVRACLIESHLLLRSRAGRRGFSGLSHRTHHDVYQSALQLVLHAYNTHTHTHTCVCTKCSEDHTRLSDWTHTHHSPAAVVMSSVPSLLAPPPQHPTDYRPDTQHARDTDTHTHTHTKHRVFLAQKGLQWWLMDSSLLDLTVIFISTLKSIKKVALKSLF